MKKLVMLSFLPIILASCGKTPEAPATGSGAYKKWSYFCPTQAPSVAMAEFASLDKFETTSDPSLLAPAMIAGQYDVVIAPTNVGMQAIKSESKAPYKLLATITFGNFYIAATGNDDDEIMDVSDYIVIFQPPGIPNKVFSYCYGGGFDAVAHNVGTNANAQACLELGRNDLDSGTDVDYVLVAEPSLTLGLNQNSNARIYEDLQNKYYSKSGGSLITQASIFVKNTLESKDIKEEFLPLLKSSIEGFIAKPSDLKKAMNKVTGAQSFFGVEPAVAEEATKNGNRMGLGIKESKDILTDTNKFLGVIGAPQATNEDLA